MPLFSITLPVEKKHVEGGRATHIALIELLMKARLAFLEKHRMTEDCIIPSVGFVIGKLEIDYRSAAREGDRLSIFLSIKDIAEKRCTLSYQIKKLDNTVVVLAKTEIVFVDMVHEKSTKIPKEFLQIAEQQNQAQPLVSRL